MAHQSRLKTVVAAEEAARVALAGVGATQWVGFSVAESHEETFTQEHRGRAGSDTRYRRHQRAVFTVAAKVDAEKVSFDATTDGCFPLITNDLEMTPAAVLAAYRYQPNLEQRHHMLKGRRWPRCSWRARTASRPCSPATSSPWSPRRSSSGRSVPR